MRKYTSCILFSACTLWAQNTSSPSIESMDRELVAATNKNDSILWNSAKNLTIEGMGWKLGIEDYTRLPDKYKGIVKDNVWNLSRHSTCITVRFVVKGTKFVSAKWTLKQNRFLAHMTPQAINGLDMYVRLNNKWTWCGVGKPGKDGLQQESEIRNGFDPNKEYERMVYLPLYTAISGIQIGVAKSATIKPAQINRNKPLVFYGTSILHGCSASRAGMAFSSMLGRAFDAPVVNLGFSGNGFMDPEFGDIMSEIDAAVYYLDCLPNMGKFTPQETTERTLTIARKLKSAHPNTPIVLVEERTHTNPQLGNKPSSYPRRAGLKAAFEILQKQYSDIYYVEGDLILGDDKEATVDGSHPSDLGMYRYLQTLEPVTEKALKVKKK